MGNEFGRLSLYVTFSRCGPSLHRVLIHLLSVSLVPAMSLGLFRAGMDTRLDWAPIKPAP